MFNNSSSLPVLHKELRLQLGDADAYEIIFIDDASTDNSVKVMNELKELHSNIKVIQIAKNLGQWEATLVGMSQSRCEYIVTLDADLQYDPADISRLYQHLLERNYLLVYGIPIRMLKGAGWIRNKFQNLILRKSLTSSFKILHRSIAFDSQNKFTVSRHFEAHEKFQVPSERRGWIRVNTSGRRGGGFRNNMIRNTKIMLSHLPEYDPKLRHPLIFYGAGILLADLLITAVMFVMGFMGYTLINVLFPMALFFFGMLLVATGIIWERSYKRILKERRQILLKLTT